MYSSYQNKQLAYIFHAYRTIERVEFCVQIIIIIIKYIYIAQGRTKQCLQFVSERIQRNAWCSQFSRKTVPDPRSLTANVTV